METNTDTTPDLITVSAAAAAIGVNSSSLRYRLLRGTMAGVKIGPLWLIPRAEVERSIVEGKRRAGRKPAQTPAAHDRSLTP